MLFIVLFIATAVWVILFCRSIEEYARYYEAEPNLPYQAWNSGLFFLVSGLVLLCTWAIAGVVKRNLQICVAVIGIVIAFGFSLAANIENIGYSVEYLARINEGPGLIVTLNPFLHLGGGRALLKVDPMDYAGMSSTSIRNLLLYLFYGELISFSLMGIYLVINKFLPKTKFHRTM
jgi:hypothetical protein